MASKDEHLDPENLHIQRWNSVADGTSFTRKFVPEQTLFGKRRAHQRKVAYAEFEGICSGDRAPGDHPAGKMGDALTDKWGVFWQITPIVLIEAITHPDPAVAKRAFDAMMQMVKIDIAAIEAALDS